MSLSSSSLSAELSLAMEADRLAHAVDAAKKRALHSCASYEEFRNRVACAGLTPVGRAGALGSIVVAGAPPRWQTARGVSGGAGGGHSDSAHTPTASAPALEAAASATDFYRAWRTAKTAPDSAFESLVRLSLRDGGLPLLLSRGGDLDGVVLGEIISCCAGAVARMPNHAKDAAALLLQLPAARGFGMAADMLSSVEVASARTLLTPERRGAWQGPLGGAGEETSAHT